MIVVGFLAFLIAPYGAYHYRDKATARAKAYAHEHAHDFNVEEFSRAMDDSLAQTRPQRVAFYVVQFGGFILACWGASRLRRKPEVSG